MWSRLRRMPFTTGSIRCWTSISSMARWSDCAASSTSRALTGRPSMAPGVYFRSLLIGYFEGLDSERGIAWRTADSLSLRKFLGYALDEATPDHSTISRTRRLYWLETHTAIFRWVLKILDEEGLVSGRTVSIDATTLEANAAMKSIVRRDNGQSYNDYLKELAR